MSPTFPGALRLSVFHHRQPRTRRHRGLEDAYFHSFTFVSASKATVREERHSALKSHPPPRSSLLPSTAGPLLLNHLVSTSTIAFSDICFVRLSGLVGFDAKGTACVRGPVVCVSPTRDGGHHHASCCSPLLLHFDTTNTARSWLASVRPTATPGPRNHIRSPWATTPATSPRGVATVFCTYKSSMLA